MRGVAEQLKRERFLPYAYEGFGIGFTVRRSKLDGSRVQVELDQERRIIQAEDQAWERLELELELEVKPSLLKSVLVRSELAEPPTDLLVVVRCDSTHLRRAHVVAPAPLRAGTFRHSLEIRREDVLGVVEVTPFLTRARDIPGSLASAAGSKSGVRLASARPWELRVDRQRPPTGRYLDIRYRGFGEDDILRAFSHALYRLECDQASPILWINSDHPKLVSILDDRAAVGRRARLRDVFNDFVAHAVWLQLFLRSVTRLARAGEFAYPWEDSVLRTLLPQVYPGLSSHEARLRKLKAELAELGYESLPSLVDRLDAALQQQHELCSGMVKLIEEAVEGAAS